MGSLKSDTEAEEKVGQGREDHDAEDMGLESEVDLRDCVMIDRREMGSMARVAGFLMNLTVSMFSKKRRKK
jgi:hypothetical protein